MSAEVHESAAAEEEDSAESGAKRRLGRAQTWASDGRRVLGTRVNVKGVVRAAREPQKPKRRLGNITEQRVLKHGIRRLNSLLVREGIDLLELPRKPDGTPRLLRPRFLERMLSNEVQLQTSMPSDVAAAQSDLKLLRLEQLLAIRVSALDFATSSQSHEAHNNFLNTLDRHLFESAARQHIQDRRVGLPSTSAPLYRLGLQMCLVLGAAAILEDGLVEMPSYRDTSMCLTPRSVADDAPSCSAPSSPASPASPLSPLSPSSAAPGPPLPSRWALPLEAGQWPDDLSAVLFDTAFLGLEPLHKETVVAASAGEKVAVICDRTSGVGKDRMMHWEIAAVDPAKEDLFAELDRAQRAGGGGRDKAKSMGQELNALLTRRKAASDAAELHDGVEKAAELHDGVEKATEVMKRRATVAFDVSEQDENPTEQKPSQVLVRRVECSEEDEKPSVQAPSQECASVLDGKSTETNVDGLAERNGRASRRSNTRSNSPQMPALPGMSSRPRPSIAAVPSATNAKNGSAFPLGRTRAMTAPASVDLLDSETVEACPLSEIQHRSVRPPRRMTVAVPAISGGAGRQCGPMPLPPAAPAPRSSAKHRVSGIMPLPPPSSEEFCPAQPTPAKGLEHPPSEN